jgi:hypothetical protein
MGKSIPYEVRKKIVFRLKNKEEVEEIAEDYGYSLSGVRKIWRAYKKHGEGAFHTNYANCGISSRYGEEVTTAIASIRDNAQGATYVHSKLLQKYPDLAVPTARTIQRWWEKSGTNRTKGRPRKQEKKSGVPKPTIHGK